eukprot:g72273.t1
MTPTQVMHCGSHQAGGDRNVSMNNTDIPKAQSSDSCVEVVSSMVWSLVPDCTGGWWRVARPKPRFTTQPYLTVSLLLSLRYFHYGSWHWGRSHSELEELLELVELLELLAFGPVTALTSNLVLYCEMFAVDHLLGNGHGDSDQYSIQVSSNMG